MSDTPGKPSNKSPFENAPFTFAPNGVLRREDFSRERITWLRKRALKYGQDWVSSHEDRDASRARIMAEIPDGEPVWVFGYGSLMWNPAFHVADTIRAQIYGYHRSFCLNLVFGRGAPDKPGLMLGLDSGGSCVGLAHKIAPEHVESELEILWYREMIGGTYRPTWVTGRTERGPVHMLTFVAANLRRRRLCDPFQTTMVLAAQDRGDLKRFQTQAHD